MHRDGSFQEFLDLLSQTLERNRDYPHTLQQELKKLIKTGKDMVQNIQCQDRSDKPSVEEVEENKFPSEAMDKENVEDKVEVANSSHARQTQTVQEQQLSTHGQQRSDSKKDKGEENNVPMSDVSDKPSVEEVEENKFPSEAMDKENVEDKLEVAKTSHARGAKSSMEEAEESKLPSKALKDINKKNAEDKVEVADSSYARYLEEELSKCKRDLEAKERKIESLITRLAHCSEKQAKRDQRNVEDTLSLNRQSRVVQDFKNFSSDERVDACLMIQRGYKEKTDINAKRLTCMIFEAVYEYVLAAKIAMTDAFKEISKFVVDHGPYIGHYCSEQSLKKKEGSLQISIPLYKSGSEYPRDVLDGLLLSIKESAPQIDTDRFLKGVKQEILRLGQVPDGERSCKLIPSLKLLDDLDDYLKACIKLTWQMVTQVPSLRLEYQTFTYNRDCHKVVEPEASPERYQRRKVYYLWPGLVDGEGRIISAGEVVLQQQR
ncbi:hypothetical protein ACROYT_G033435 [Oculina patagonica]